MSAPAARSAALSLYRQYLRTAAGVPKLHVRVSTRRAVRMAFRARAYDYLTAAAGDGGVGAAEAAAEEWIRHGREDLVTWQALTRMDPAALNAVLFPGPPAADASVAATAPRGGDATPSGHSGAGT
ncbi:hypothetical protein I4F81_009244 [Pyropia yezoensis]|uniref:Uncharacterized protein n=1 Tax=Pyropia yezoensis TaxID=2788 RepID=A0ACC3C9A8_PYRYE|nr:hypothetical protein I4F81_009244 [Neopyropia yezoensis]